jgi:hypothetical protein
VLKKLEDKMFGFCVLIFLALWIHSNGQSRCGIVQSAITKWPLRASTELAGHTRSGDWPVCRFFNLWAGLRRIWGDAASAKRPIFSRDGACAIDINRTYALIPTMELATKPASLYRTLPTNNKLTYYRVFIRAYFRNGPNAAA